MKADPEEWKIYFLINIYFQIIDQFEYWCWKKIKKQNIGVIEEAFLSLKLKKMWEGQSTSEKYEKYAFIAAYIIL